MAQPIRSTSWTKPPFKAERLSGARESCTLGGVGPVVTPPVFVRDPSDASAIVKPTNFKRLFEAAFLLRGWRVSALHAAGPG